MRNAGCERGTTPAARRVRAERERTSCAERMGGGEALAR